MSDPRWPLGEPINRPAPKSPWHPIPGRPRWERHSETGQERYVEPPRPPPWMPPPV